MAQVQVGPHAQGALTPQTIKRTNEAVSEYPVDDKKLSGEVQDLYLQQQCEKHREQNQQIRQQQRLRQAAICAGRWA